MKTLIQGFDTLHHNQDDTGNDRHDNDQVENPAVSAVGFVDYFVKPAPPVTIGLVSSQVRSIFHKYRNFSEPNYLLHLMTQEVFLDDYVLGFVESSRVDQVFEYCPVGDLMSELGVAVASVLVFLNENHGLFPGDSSFVDQDHVLMTELNLSWGQLFSFVESGPVDTQFFLVFDSGDELASGDVKTK